MTYILYGYRDDNMVLHCEVSPGDPKTLDAIKAHNFQKIMIYDSTTGRIKKFEKVTPKKNKSKKAVGSPVLRITANTAN